MSRKCLSRRGWGRNLQAPWLPAMDHGLRNPAFPLLEEGQVLLPVPKAVGKHNGDLVDDGVVSPAFAAQENALDDQLVFRGELKELERIVLVYGTGENVEELPLHTADERLSL